MQLRPPQQKTLEASKERLIEGVYRQLASLATGIGKCLGKGTPILMFDGTIKPVEDVAVGDLLMGPDSTPRTVLSTATGRDELYDVVPVKGDPYTVNKSHILSVKMTPRRRGQWHTVVNLSVADYLERNAEFKHRAKGYRVGVDFSEKAVPLDPYYLGAWLGDGTIRSSQISNNELEILEYIDSYAPTMGLRLAVSKPNEKCSHYAMVGPCGKPNPVVGVLRQLGLTEHKHIPHVYKANSRNNRLQLLAGLLDTDGFRTHGGCEISSVSKELAADINYLARSLGLAAYTKAERKSCQTGATGTYYRTHISGDLTVIPYKVPRRIASPRLQKKDVLVTGIKLVPKGVGDYYGFEIDGDRLFLLGDFTVTHNTVIFASLRETHGFKKRIMVLVHTDELAEQAIKKLRVWNPGVTIGLEMGESYALDTDTYVVASVQTLGREGSPRLNRFKPQDFDALIIDECHHTPAESYQRIISHFGLQKGQDNQDRMLFGVTATTKRGDGQGLDQNYDEIIYEYGLLDAIRDGYLCNLRGYRVRTSTNLDTVHTSDGELNQTELSLAVNTPERNRAVVQAWVDRGENRQTIAFTVDIQHAKDLAQAFRDAGYSFEAVWGVDPERESKLLAHRTGELRGLCNAQMLVEGYDDPSVACVINAAPTKSQSKYQQRAGRGTRLQDGIANLIEARSAGVPILKEDCILLDVADDTRRHSLASLATLVGVPSKLDFNGLNVLEVIAAIEEAEKASPETDFSQLEDLNEIQSYIERVDLFATKWSPETLEHSELQWHKTPKGNYLLLLPTGEQITLGKDYLNNWQIKGSVKGNSFRDIAHDLAEAFSSAEGLLRTFGKNLLAYVRREKPVQYGKARATDTQIASINKRLAKMGRPPEDVSTMSSIEAGKYLLSLYTPQKAA